MIVFFSKFDVNSQSTVFKYLLNRLDISRVDEWFLIPVYWSKSGSGLNHSHNQGWKRSYVVFKVHLSFRNSRSDWVLGPQDAHKFSQHTSDWLIRLSEQNSFQKFQPDLFRIFQNGGWNPWRGWLLFNNTATTWAIQIRQNNDYSSDSYLNLTLHCWILMLYKKARKGHLPL